MRKGYRKEKLKKCGTCHHLFNGKCQTDNTTRYAVQIACYNYKPKQEKT